MEPDAEAIGNRLKQFASAQYGSVRQLAIAIGERPDNLQKYASGRHLCGARLLMKLVGAGCNVHWLLVGVGKMQAETAGVDSKQKRTHPQ